MFAPATSARTPNLAAYFSVDNGTLVRMINGNKTIIEVSLSDVGHRLAHEAIIVDASGKPIPARRIPIRQLPKAKILYDREVYDPGPQYQHAFDPKALPQHAMVLKA